MDYKYAKISNFGSIPKQINKNIAMPTNLPGDDLPDFGLCVIGSDQSLFPDMDVTNTKSNCRELIAEYIAKNGWDDNAEMYYQTHPNALDRSLLEQRVAFMKSQNMPKVAADIYPVNPARPTSVLVSRVGTTAITPMDLNEVQKVKDMRVDYWKKQGVRIN